MLDKFKDECGVFGIFGHPEAANMAYLGLYALQHRGQESAGIAASDGVQLRVRSEEHTSELQSRLHLVCRLLLEKKKKITTNTEQSTMEDCIHSYITRTIAICTSTAS